MRTKLLILVFVLILFLPLPTFAENPRSYGSIKVKITQGGSLVSSDVNNMNLSVFIPQENIAGIDVFTDGGEWKYIYDSYGNKKILMEWEKPGNIINYKIEAIIENSAEHLYSEKAIGTNSEYLKETEHVIIDDNIKELSYPFETSLKRAAELTGWVNKYMTYDLSYSSREMTSADVLSERRGVCSAFATLLAAMLRANGIPARYVAGYAYSDVQNKFIGHAWVEVLLSDGAWAQFDPTWLQAGYVDATHIKTGSFMDTVSASEISYTKASRNSFVNWDKDDEKFETLNYSIKTPISIGLDGKRSIFSNAYGYVKATINSSQCLFSEIAANACINENSQNAFEIYDKNRSLWSCGNSELYFFFMPVNKNKFSYLCPITVYDQTGSEGTINITVHDKGEIGSIYISGPETAGINENIQLAASTDKNFIFYSPSFGRHDDNIWDINIKQAGTYRFYLYSDGALATKDVNVVEQKEFDLSVSAPKNASINANFTVNIGIKNLQSKRKTAQIIIEFDGQKISESIEFDANQQREFSFNLTAKEPGQRKVSVSVLSDSLTAQSSPIYVYEIRTNSWLDGIVGFFADILNWFLGLF